MRSSYDQRLHRAAAEAAAPDVPPAQRGAVVQEMVRWLALWMAFDDIVRVAAAKLAASRMARVQREVGLRDGDLLKVYDHFKPGVPELAALLPPARPIGCWPGTGAAWRRAWRPGRCR
jgi:indolepyruvate ferredoxin oxidoreductase beta subunit